MVTRLGRGALVLALASSVAPFAVSDALAGAFAIREQSTVGQGASYAGIAAGGAVSSMFWNPATLTQLPGMQGESSYTGVLPSASHSYSASGLATAVPPLYANPGDNSGRDALVPATYSSFQVNDRLWLGLSINAPYGLSVGFPRTWAGAGYGQNSEITTYTFTPSVAYRLTNWLSVGVGVQAQYMKVEYDALVSAFPAGVAQIEGNGWSWGWTAGITVTPTPATQIGLGYRSGIDQKIDGSMTLPPGPGFSAPFSTPGDVSTTLRLPDTLTFGLRQRLNERFTFLLGAEWSNWSRIGTAALAQPNGSSALIGLTAVNLPFQYDDSWFVSVGGEYEAYPGVTLRAGFAYEKSPITDQVRTPRLPDNDRYWFSAGASFQHPQLKALTFDVAYSYILVKDTPINISAASGNPWLNATGPYIGNVDSNIQIISVGIRYKTDELLKMLMHG